MSLRVSSGQGPQSRRGRLKTGPSPTVIAPASCPHREEGLLRDRGCPVTEEPADTAWLGTGLRVRALLWGWAQAALQRWLLVGLH